jgi:hypothetical protein
VADTLVDLPFAEVGGEAEAATFMVQNTGDVAFHRPVRFNVEGPFRVDGEALALAPGESAELSIVPTYDTSETAIYSGTISVDVDEWKVSAEVYGLVGTAGLDAAKWRDDEWGTYTIVDLPSAPFPDGHASYTDASVMIGLPATWDDNGELAVVTHLHGHNATIEEVDEEQYLRAQFSLSGRNAIFILPQGPVEAADSDFGKLDEEEGFYNLVMDAIAVLYRDGVVTRPNLGEAALTSHSGGYNAVANMLEVGGVAVSAVHLFDSLYARESTYEQFVREGGVLRSVYTSGGGTDDNNRAMAISQVPR